MKQLTILLVLIATITTSFTCSKEDKKSDDSPEAKLLASGPWKRISQIVLKTGSPDEDIYTVKLPCYKDNLYTYFPDLTYKWDEGATICPGSQQTDGCIKTWELKDGGKVLWVTDCEEQGGTVYKYEVTELTASKLTLKEVYEGGAVVSSYAH